MFKIFVSKTKNEGMVGNGSPVSLGFLREGVWLWDTWVTPARERERDAIPQGPEMTGKHVFFSKGNYEIVRGDIWMGVFEIILCQIAAVFSYHPGEL